MYAPDVEIRAIQPVVLDDLFKRGFPVFVFPISKNVKFSGHATWIHLRPRPVSPNVTANISKSATTTFLGLML
jgi:hypothetical protein